MTLCARTSRVRLYGLVSQSLRFLSTAVCSGNYREIFESRETIDDLVEGVVVRNVSLGTHEVVQFEDDALEYVHLDLTFASASSAAIADSPTAEGTTWRQAIADVLRALVTSGYAAVTTEIVLQWIGKGLQEYVCDLRGEDSWKRKDQSVYLLAAVTTAWSYQKEWRAQILWLMPQTSSHEMQSRTYKSIPTPCIRSFKSTQFASYTVFDLKSGSSQRNSLFPFFHSCANLVLPIASLIRGPRQLSNGSSSSSTTTRNHLRSSVCRHSILTLRHSRFDQDNNREILNAVPSRVESGGWPEKIVENDYFMKCVMHVILLLV
ncbi:hypothetical protein ACEPAG_3619 [Sanghuangporus baumii]